MNFLQIIQTILSVAPSGIQLTQEVVALVQAIEAAFTAGPDSGDSPAGRGIGSRQPTSPRRRNTRST